MGFLPEWLALIPASLLLLLSLFLPGMLAIRALGASWGWGFVLGPAVTSAIVGVTSYFLYPTILWGPLAFIGVSAVAIAVSALAGFAIRRKWDLRPAGIPIGWYPRNIQWASIASAIAVSLILIVPILVIMDPTLPQAKSDPMYHYNVINAIEQKGAANSLYAARSNYGVRILNITYPSVFHAIIAVVASVGNIVPVANAMVYVVVPLVWTIGIVALGLVAFPRIPYAAAFLPVITLMFAVFPGLLSGTKGFWPNSFALAMVPGILAFIVWRVNRHGLDGQPQPISGIFSTVIVLAAIGGSSLAHPSVAFTLVFSLAPALIVGTFRLGARIFRAPRRRRDLPIFVAAITILFIAVGTVLANRRVSAYLNREFLLEWEDIPRRIISSIILWSAGTNLVLNLILFFAVLVPVIFGARIALQHRSTKWIALGWFIHWALILGALFPLGPLTQVAGLWYHDVYRLYSVQVLFTSSLITLFAADLYQSLSPRSSLFQPKHAPAVVVSVSALVLGGGTVFLKAPTFYSDLAPKIGEDEFINSRGEVELFTTLDTVIPAQSVVIGDPTTGVGYLPAYADLNSVYTQTNIRSLDWDGEYLYENFHDIQTDPMVCEILDFYSIEYFYEDDPIVYVDEDREEIMPGFYNVDTSNGFELVAEADGSAVWRITACGPMDPPQWWEYRERRFPLIQPDIHEQAEDATQEDAIKNG